MGGDGEWQGTFTFAEAAPDGLRSVARFADVGAVDVVSGFDWL